MAKVVYHISSPMNISFRHELAEVDTTDLSDDWDDLSDAQKEDLMYDDRFLNEIVWDAVEVRAEVVE